MSAGVVFYDHDSIVGGTGEHSLKHFTRFTFELISNFPRHKDVHSVLLSKELQRFITVKEILVKVRF